MMKGPFRAYQKSSIGPERKSAAKPSSGLPAQEAFIITRNLALTGMPAASEL